MKQFEEERKYYDCEGNERTLYWMVKNEPSWAANVIPLLRKIIVKCNKENEVLTRELSELNEENERLRDIFREIESFNKDGPPLCCPNCVMELQEYLSTITEQALKEKK